MSPSLSTYAILRRGGWASAADLEAAGRVSSDVAESDFPDDIRWIRSYVTEEPDGRVGTICIYQATSADKVREHAARAGLPADEVIPIAGTVVVHADPEAEAAA